MRRMKKLLAFLLAAIMVMSMGSVSVMASSDGTIKITGVSENSTYYAYQIFSGTYSSGALTNIGTGSGLNVSTTAQITAITSLLTGSTASINVTYNGVDYTTLGDLATQYLADNPNNSIAWIAEFLTAFGSQDESITIAFAEITAQFLTSTYYTGSYDSGTYTFSNLPDGYYLIVDMTSSTYTANSAYSRYMLVLAGESIAQKSVVPTINKEIVLSSGNTDTTTASIGDTVSYVLTSSVPDMTGYSSYTYIITDTICKGLTLTETTSTTNVSSNAVTAGLYELDLKITVGTATISGQRLTGASDTTAVSTYAYYYYTSTDSNGVTTLTIVFNNFIDSGYTTGAAISVTYSATLDDDAVIGSSGNENTVTLTYSNNPNLVYDNGSWSQSTDTGETVKVKAVVYTYELDLTKVDSVDSTSKLSGAEFYLMDSAGNYAIVEEDTSGTDGYYTVTGWTTDASAKSTLTSGTNGELYISGLGAGTYYLYESAAPTGYVIWTDPMTIVITATTDATSTTSLSATVGGTAATTSTSAGTITASITNSSSAALPSTGGLGTVMIYVLGGCMVVITSILLITKKRMAGR